VVVVEVLLVFDNARREDVLIMLMGTALGCRKALLLEAVVADEEEEEEEEEGALRAVPKVLLDEAPKLRDGMILRFAIRPANVELGSLRVLPLLLLLLLLLLRDLNVLLGTYPPDEALRLRLTTAGACFFNC
jgi:hypothetical protein